MLLGYDLNVVLQDEAGAYHLRVNGHAFAVGCCAGATCVVRCRASLIFRVAQVKDPIRDVNLFDGRVDHSFRAALDKHIFDALVVRRWLLGKNIFAHTVSIESARSHALPRNHCLAYNFFTGYYEIGLAKFHIACERRA